MLRCALRLIQSIHILGVMGGKLMAIEIITNNQAYNDELIQMNNYCFNFLSKEDLEQYLGFLSLNDDATILGTIEEDTLYASLMILKLSTYWNNQKIKVGGIGNVCSMPEWREKHAIAGLIKESLKLMKQNNQIFSLLGPFHYDFYRRYGWEWGEQKKIITMGINDLKDFKSDGYRYSRLSYDNYKEMNDVYESYFSQYNGATVRDENRWQLFLLMNEKEDAHIYGVYNDQNKLCGYICYKIDNDCIRVKELVYLSNDDKKRLLRFIYVHRAQSQRVEITLPSQDSMLLMLKNQHQEVKLKSGMMVRIVDVEKVLKLLYKDVNYDLCCSIEVRDDLAPWNNGIFILRKKYDESEIVKDNTVEPDIRCTIQTLSQILFGFNTFKKANELGLISSNKANVLELLDKKIECAKTYITDRF